MKKTTLILLVSFILINVSFTQPKRLYVDIKTSLADLKGMIKFAKPGTTIFFRQGHYVFNNTINIRNKNYLKIIGLGKVKIVCNATDVSVLSLFHCKNITISNLHLTHNPMAEGCSGFVMSTSDCKNIVINTCKLNGCGVTGLITWSTSGIILDNCDIFNNSSSGLCFNGSKNITISNCRIYKNKETGLGLYRSENVTIINTKIYNNNVGLEIHKTKKVYMRGVRTYNNGINVKK